MRAAAEGRAGGGGGRKQGAGTSDGNEDAQSDRKSASAGEGQCGSPGKDGGACPNHHGGGASGSIAQGDPVDVATGRVFTLPAVDLSLPGPLPLIFARSYNAAVRTRDIGLGFGWSHSFAWEISVRRRDALVLTSHGSTARFEPFEKGFSRSRPARLAPASRSGSVCPGTALRVATHFFARSRHAPARALPAEFRRGSSQKSNCSHLRRHSACCAFR